MENVTNVTTEEADGAVGGGNSDELRRLYEFLVKGVLLGLVSLMGILGNVLTMVILSRPQMRSSINCLLVGLARCDAALLVAAILIFSLPSVATYTGCLPHYMYYVYPSIARIVYPMGLIAQTGSVYLTLTVTLERYVAVCHPLRARSLCTYGRARIYVVLIIVFSVLYNLPRFFEVERVTGTLPPYNTTIYMVSASALRNDPLYITIYVNWTYLLVMYFVPFLALAIFNCAIYMQVRKANAERQRLSRLQKKEIGLATMLMCVVVVFFMCNILPLVNNVLEAFYGILQDELIATSNLLVAINSSVNFVIYVIFGDKFKRLFFKIFWPQRGRCCRGGNDSPEATHEESFVSNGRTFSVRQPSSRMARNNGSRDVKLQLLAPSTRSPCVYYPTDDELKGLDEQC
ncbi:FMRFamide receptor [Neocloeon triangulifer]|uniref:FMRFamide receptor n=1 Tax=Neocloeon triangulifer TaxID=2078957 RepID=UPI00286F4B53|nr:FMRFamide receptor [Neocloeon triangulifer]XP_059480857.1 FMRFamide receptor [Neocloeon triangulifer]